jgi:arylsulfatase A-like enzyme
MSSARHLVARPEIGLVLLHLPVPHPPAYYDRKSGLINSEIPGTYEDGLALLDRTLQELRTTMEAAGQWEGSFVLITTDHPLRASRGTRAFPFC